MPPRRWGSRPRWPGTRCIRLRGPSWPRPGDARAGTRLACEETAGGGVSGEVSRRRAGGSRASCNWVRQRSAVCRPITVAPPARFIWPTRRAGLPASTWTRHCAPTPCLPWPRCSGSGCACSCCPATGRARSGVWPGAPASSGAGAINRPRTSWTMCGGCSKAAIASPWSGDGMNDGPVLARADVSVAMGHAVPLAQAKADFVVLGGQLSAVPSLLAACAAHAQRRAPEPGLGRRLQRRLRAAGRRWAGCRPGWPAWAWRQAHCWLSRNSARLARVPEKH